jgi:hypothetical protein
MRSARDAIPVHHDAEALALYERSARRVLLVNISNQHLRLEPEVAAPPRTPGW